MIKKDSCYIPNAGQTIVPSSDSPESPRIAWTPLPKLSPPLPPLQFKPKRKKEGWFILADFQHPLPGVTPDMIDWFWVNMEKCYYLWAPGDHNWFEWVNPPNKVGFVGSSVRLDPEELGGLASVRKDMDWYPFTGTPLSHVMNEVQIDETFAVIHQWEAADCGSIHRMTAITNKKDFSVGDKTKPDHADYEEALWCEFLPALYNLWKNQPNPWQNVQCNLRVKKLSNGEWAYVAKNKPPAK